MNKLLKGIQATYFIKFLLNKILNSLYIMIGYAFNLLYTRSIGL